MTPWIIASIPFWLGALLLAASALGDTIGSFRATDTVESGKMIGAAIVLYCASGAFSFLAAWMVS